jgi:NAD(P)-dependent dehydrogenase (short-subunit alcohol dehydrogenase family)
VESRSTLGALLPPPLDHPPFAPDLLAGQIALVTGGSSGMGLGMAMGLAQAGADVAIVGRTVNRLDGAMRALAPFGRRVHPLACDVRREASVAAAFDEVEDALGPVTILANNAGTNFPSLAESMSANTWRAVVRIAVDGTFLCCAQFARRCKERGTGGAIVNNSAQYIYSGFPGDAHSASAKAAIAHMGAAMARDWAADGIRVNTIAAGFFPHDGAPGGMPDEAGMAQMGSMFPIGRPGEMREFGWISTLLVSPLTAGITGETIMIDGAEHLRTALLKPAFVPPRERSNPWGDQTP